MSICGGSIFRKFSQKIRTQGHQLKVGWESVGKLRGRWNVVIQKPWTMNGLFAGLIT